MKKAKLSFLLQGVLILNNLLFSEIKLIKFILLFLAKFEKTLKTARLFK